MMIKTNFLATGTGLALLLSAAGAQADDHCADVPNIRLTAAQNHLWLNSNNKPVCVSPDADGMIDHTFVIKIMNPVEVSAGDVTVIHKGDDEDPAVTITGDNSQPANKVTIRIEGEADVDDIFDYLIDVDGIGVLDPRVRVVDSDTETSLQIAALEDFLDAWDLTPDALITLARTIKPED